MAEIIDIQRVYECHLQDLAVAFYKVTEAAYGIGPMYGHRPSWYRRRLPLAYLTVKTGIDQVTRGINDFVRIWGISGFFRVGGDKGEPVVFARISKRDEGRTEKFLQAIEKHLRTNSIYRGKAITTNGEFLDLSGVSPESILYNAKVLRDLNAHVWTLLDRSDLCRAGNIEPIQRKILCSGRYGSGKTTAGYLSAKKANEYGWTVLYLPPTSRNNDEWASHTYAIARRYQPSFVLIEDIDREQRHSNEYILGQVLAEVDGVKSKGDSIITMMTTNSLEKIAPGMQRPGRIDKVIQFDIFTAEDVEMLLQKVIPGPFLSPEIGWQRVTAKCEGYNQSFVREVAKSATLLAISEADAGRLPVITEAMFVEAADDLRMQHKATTSTGMGFNGKD